MRFVERVVFEWIRMILARQPDATFVFIITKEDVAGDSEFVKCLMKDELKKKLRDIDTLVLEMKRQVNQLPKSRPVKEPSSTGPLPGDPNDKKRRVLYVNSTSDNSVQAARANVIELITNSGLSIPMPDTYTEVFEKVIMIREQAKTQDVVKRLEQTFAQKDELPNKLQVEPEQCRLILQTLHDLGDVLWYEDLNVGVFRDTIILDPMLLIGFIREVINHKHTGQTISHINLVSKECWMGLREEKLILSMTMVLQEFHLVHSTDDDRVMKWDSHLIVPAYWLTKPPACWRFLGQDLGVQVSVVKIGVHVCWEYHFNFGFPSSLFNHVVVASISEFYTFDAGPDWILHDGNEGITACRIMVNRDHRTLHRTIQV